VPVCRWALPLPRPTIPWPSFRGRRWKGTSSSSSWVLPTVWGARYFQIWLKGRGGRLSDRPLLEGLHHVGPFPSAHWIEVMALARQNQMGGEGVRLSEEQEGRLWSLLGRIIPPGGHLMAEYESPEEEESRSALSWGVPPVLTPLGFRMFQAGCGAGFKDWYFAEGWAEGPRKLQGFKAPDEVYWKEKAAQMALELHAFLSSKEGRRYLESNPRALERAIDVLSQLSPSR